MWQTIFESNNNRISQTLLNYNLLFKEKRNKSLKRIPILQKQLCFYWEKFRFDLNYNLHRSVAWQYC